LEILQWKSGCFRLSLSAQYVGVSLPFIPFPVSVVLKSLWKVPFLPLWWVLEGSRIKLMFTCCVLLEFWCEFASMPLSPAFPASKVKDPDVILFDLHALLIPHPFIPLYFLSLCSFLSSLSLCPVELPL
jgi:hypothetical protein